MIKKQLASQKDSVKYVDLLNQVGFLMHITSADSSLHYGIAAKVIAERLAYSKGIAEATNNIAASLFLHGLYSQSLKTFSEALDNYEDADDLAGRVSMLTNMAVVYDVIGEKELATRFSRKALSLSAPIASDSVMSMIYPNYVYLNPTLPADSAANFLDKAGHIAEKFKDDRSKIMIWQQRAARLLSDKQWKQAQGYIQKSLALAKRHQWDYHEIVGLEYLADYYNGISQPDSALKSYSNAYNKASALGFTTFKMEILKLQLEVYRKTGRQSGIDKSNAELVGLMQQELMRSKQFLADYVAFYDQQEALRAIRKEQQQNQKKIYMLLTALIVTLLTGAYTIYLYRRLKASAIKQKELTTLVEAKNRDLQKEDEFRSTLVSMIAHDFRAPLSTTLGMLELLRDQDIDAAFLQEFYQTTQNQIESILSVFDNILNWTKIQYSGYNHKFEDLHLRSLFEEVLQLYQSEIEKKQLIVSVDVPGKISVFTDREILQFLNRNLIQNAVKYSPHAGALSIDARLQDGQVIVTISDQGVGMSESQITSLFTTKHGTVTDKSAGVALKIAKDLVKMLGGELWAESRKGEGSYFFYTINQ